MPLDFMQLHHKLHLIFWPFLLLAGLFLAGYGLLDGGLLLWAPTFEPPDEWRELLVPALAAAGLVLLVLWPRLRLLESGAGNRDPRLWLAMIAVCVLSLEAFCAHQYLQAALSRLVVFTSPRSMPATAPTSYYYQFRQEYLTARYSSPEADFSTTDKGQKVVFHFYVATPMLAGPADTLHPVRVWCGHHYSQEINASASEAERETAFRAFAQRTEQQVQQEKFAVPFGYYERMPNTQARVVYTKAARRTGLCPPDTTLPLLLLQPATEGYAGRGLNSGYWALGWFGGGSTLFFFVLLFPYLSPTKVAEFEVGQREPVAWLSWLRPRPNFWVLPLLLVVNAGIYIVMALCSRSGLESFAPGLLRAWGANYGPAVAQGQWWRLLSNTFLHGNLLHLVNNMVSLWLLGWLLEPAMGSGRLALLYLAAGVAGSLCSLAWHPAAIGVGASGAILGLMGAALVLAWRRALSESIRSIVLVFAVLSGGLSLLLGFVMPGVNNAAHLGGLLAGAVLGWLLSPSVRRRIPQYEAASE